MRTWLSLLTVLTTVACTNGGSDSAGTAGAAGGAAAPNGDSDLSFASFTDASATTADATAFANAIDVFAADVADINGRPLDDYYFTAYDGVPTRGSASYTGYINVNAGAEANLAAGLTLDANFADGELTASQTSDFFADAGGRLEQYDGTLTFENGLISARGIPNSARLDVAGTLRSDTNTVVVDGEIFGKLVGTPVVGMSANTTVAEAAARENADRAMNITLNGAAVTDGSAGFVVIDDTLR